jgi:hypothetical protein
MLLCQVTYSCDFSRYKELGGDDDGDRYMEGSVQLKYAKSRVHNSSPKVYDDRSPSNFDCYKSQHRLTCTRTQPTRLARDTFSCCH